MSEYTCVTLAHCIFSGGLRIRQWHHDLPPGVPPLPHSFVVSLMDNRDGKRLIRGCVIFKSDAPPEHPQLGDYARAVVDSVPALGQMLREDDQSVLLVNFKLRDPLAFLSESECETVFFRQFTEHQRNGEA